MSGKLDHGKTKERLMGLHLKIFERMKYGCRDDFGWLVVSRSRLIRSLASWSTDGIMAVGRMSR